MKANELMIFDLIRRKKDNRTMIVVEVGYDENIGAITTDDRFYGDFEDYHETQVEPIPITPEILEKNGFSRNGLDIALFDRKGGDDFVGASNLQYVHELQHCLKLVDIDKTIVV